MSGKTSWDEMGGGTREVRPAPVEQQAKSLTKLRDLLETALVSKQREMEDAQVMLARLKHGGGS